MTDWIAVANCTVDVDLTQGFTGVTYPTQKHALKVTCNHTGTATFKLNVNYPVKPPKGVAWGFHAKASATPTLTATVDSYDGSNVHTNTASASKTLGSSWRPLSGRTNTNSALGGGATAYAVLSCSASMTNGDVIWLDTVGLFATVGQVMIDFLNPAFGVAAVGGNDFVDLTGRLKLDTGISIGRGASDNVSQVQAASVSFALQNDDGWFTPQCTSSPWFGSVTLGKRCQINATDEAGVWHTRFDGVVSQYDYAVDITGQTNVATIACSDVMAYLSRQEQLAAWTMQTVLADGPALLWPLSDPSGNFLEASGNNGPPLRTTSYGYTTTLTGDTSPSDLYGQLNYQGGAGGIETQADTRSDVAGPYQTPLQPANFVPAFDTDVTNYNQFYGTNGVALSARLPTPITPNASASNYTVEAWFMADPALQSDYMNAAVGPFTVLSLCETRTGYTLVAGIYTNSTLGAQPTFKLASYSQPPAFRVSGFGAAPSPVATVSSTFTTDSEWQPHHLVIVFTGSASNPTATVYVDDVSIGTLNLSSQRYFDTITVGSAAGGFGGWLGSICLGGVYNSALSGAQIAAHCTVGQSGYFAAQTDAIVYQLSQIAGIPSYWNGITSNGGLALSRVDYFDLTGTTPIAAMQQCEQLEGGRLFVDASGKLRFHTRDWRMGYANPDVTLPAASYAPDLGYSLTDQYLINTATLASAISATGQTATDAASVATYGQYANGTPGSASQMALYTFSGGYGLSGLQGWDFWLDPEVADVASWQVFANSQPYMRATSVTVDLLAPDRAQPAISTLYALEIDNVIALAGLPSNLPNTAGSLDFFIEGINETIGLHSRTLQFLTTPASLQRAWQPGDSTYGALGISARVGRSASPTHTAAPMGKIHAYDAGPPYWPPTVTDTLNNPALNGHGFLGGTDIRGTVGQLQNALTPNMTVVGQTANTQTLTAGQYFTWDTVFYDVLGCVGAVGGWPNWYVCLREGYYDIEFAVNVTAGQAASLIIASQAAEAVLDGTGDPTTVTRKNTITGRAAQTRVYLGRGDMVALAANTSCTTATSLGGSILSIRQVGISTTSDQYS